MANKSIITDKYSELKLGYATHANENDVRPFTAYAGDTPKKEIPFGDILIITAVPKVYKAASNEAAGTVTAATQVAGIALSTNVKLETVFPVAGTNADNAGAYQGGDQGNNLTKGEVAVQYFGTAPSENGAVYLIADNGNQAAATLGKLTADATLGTATLVLLPGYLWTGIVDAAEGLAVVHKQY